MSSIPYNYHKYLDDVTKMRQRGAISSGEQINSPSSAGSRGLARLDQFTRDANQFMKANITESATREYKNLDKKSIEQLREKYLPDWEYKDNSLQKRYKFEDYYETIKFLINTVKPQEEKRRHIERQDTQTEKGLSGRRSQISNILTNFNLMGELEVRKNDSRVESQKIKEEIIELLK